MATATAFAYNTGSLISGTDQVGSLAVGIPTNGFESTGLEHWGGPDLELGIVVAKPIPDDSQPTPISGVTGSVAFSRTSNNPSTKEDEFIRIAYDLLYGPGDIGGNTPFADGAAASAALTAAGYWNSYSSFGSSGFQWMTMTSITNSTAAGIGQNNITVSITQNGGGMQTENGMYEPTTFPEEYGVPLSGNQIRNTKAGVFTATFSQPVLNPLVAFASVGNPGLPVPVQSTLPFTPIFGQATTYQSESSPTQYTQFTGREGFNIIRIDGTVSSVTFTYTVEEFYCTVCFGFVDQNA